MILKPATPPPPSPQARSMQPSPPPAPGPQPYSPGYRGRADWTAIDWRHLSRTQVFLGGLVVALLSSALLGLFFAPDLDGREPMRASVQDPMQIVVTPRKGPTPSFSAPGAPLPVLPVDMARAAAANLRAVNPGPSGASPAAAIPTVSAVGSQAQDGSVGVTPVTLPAPPPVASFACGGDLSRAEAMVCGDARLAAADRRMQRSWRRALASGVDPDDLRHEQREWLRAREEAAADGPEAVAALYSQRIQDLDDVADDDPGQQ